MRLKRYIQAHLIFLLFAAAFSVYGFVAIVLLNNSAYHCFMHDVLHLYCPFCGGTRAFLSCLRFDLVAAFTYNPAVLLAAVFFAILDLRALYLILRHREGALFPRFLTSLCVCYFAGYTVLRNALALYGIDPVGDIAPHWQGRLSASEAFFATLLLFFGMLAMLAALYLPQARWRPAAWLAMGGLALLLLALLFSWQLSLLLFPLAAVSVLLYMPKRKA